jgi:hypothetical protein
MPPVLRGNAIVFAKDIDFELDGTGLAHARNRDPGSTGTEMQITLMGINVNMIMRMVVGVTMAVVMIMWVPMTRCLAADIHHARISATANYTHIDFSFSVMSVVFNHHLDDAELGPASGLELVMATPGAWVTTLLDHDGFAARQAPGLPRRFVNDKTRMLQTGAGSQRLQRETQSTRLYPRKLPGLQSENGDTAKTLPLRRVFDQFENAPCKTGLMHGLPPGSRHVFRGPVLRRLEIGISHKDRTR